MSPTWARLRVAHLDYFESSNVHICPRDVDFQLQFHFQQWWQLLKTGIYCFSFLFFTFFSLLNVYLQLELLRWRQTGHHYYHTPSPTQSLSTAAAQPRVHCRIIRFNSRPPWHRGIVWLKLSQDARVKSFRTSLGISSLIVFYPVSSTCPSGPADIIDLQEGRYHKKRAQTMQNASFGPFVSFFYIYFKFYSTNDCV